MKLTSKLKFRIMLSRLMSIGLSSNDTNSSYNTQTKIENSQIEIESFKESDFCYDEVRTFISCSCPGSCPGRLTLHSSSSSSSKSSRRSTAFGSTHSWRMRRVVSS